MDFNRAGFIILTVMQILSFYCVLHLFFRYLQRRSPLRRIQNHILMYLLVVAAWVIIIDIPNTQQFLWTGTVSIQTSWFCSLWNTSFLSTATLNRFLMAFMCLERHLIVFRPQTHQSKRSRLFLHYIPLIIIVSTILIYLFIANVILSCPQLHFNYSAFMCGYTCAVYINALATIYIWILVFVPTVITIVASILLPIRFIIQKRQLQRVQWHRARKMIVQTSVIATVYSICWLSYTIILQLLVNNIVNFTNPDIGQFFTIVPYITSLLTPFIIIHTIEKPINVAIIDGIKRLCFPQRQGAILPINNFVAQQHNASLNENGTSVKNAQLVKNASSRLPES